MSRDGAPVDAAAVDALATRLAGRIVRPGDADYERARRIWNASIDRRPGLIVRVRGAADVVEAIRFARASDVKVTVRGGGHNVAGRALCDDGMVVDLSEMRAVLVDPATRTVRVQGGATLGDLDRETHAYGLAVPAGVVSATGIAGLTLGGGVGWLVRKYGLSCDNVLAMNLVDADGAVLTASADERQDLFWALKGGGGNFGVVTDFTFRAHPVSTILGGMLVWPRDRAGDVLRFYRDFMDRAPEDLTCYCAIVTSPDGVPIVAALACWSGEIAEGERFLAPLRSFGPPMADMIAPMPFPAMQRLIDGGFPDGAHNYWRSSFVHGLTDAVIDTIVAFADRMESPLSATLVEYYGGAASRVDPASSAFAQRSADYNIGMTAQWLDPAETAKHVAWTRAFYDAIEPHAHGSHLLNFNSEASDAMVQASFGDHYARLAEVKRRYDPSNFFSQDLNLRAAAA
ncbi:FAD-binding oxidoreductase [Amaricoccus sp.]|uniref:FAD-binding oxidoreductase n=1 Tax=Amaricoccus sp. TaxID=1872485 RepID=UPI001B536945|nr:FAD-binding oxidoreductase [Amaricoccus sp.]MBP7000826.1 FAD-binding oxidoreductase [Amaricoccus sp.]